MIPADAGVADQSVGTPSSTGSGGWTPRRRRRREARIALLFVLPVLLLFVLFRFGPALAGLGLSVFSYSPGDRPVPVGLDNFRRLANDPVFWRSLRITVLYSVLAVPISLLVSTVTALLVRRAFRGARFFRSVLFLPVITSLIVAGAVFSWVFSTDGPWSSILQAVGLPGDSWLTSTTLVIPALVIVSVWTRFGFGMLILLARLQDLSRELEEAALTDGANAWQRFRYLILPELRPALFFLAVLETTGSFQVFDLVYVMTGGGPARSSYTLIFELYDQGFKYFDLGYASAIGVALLVMTLIVAAVQRMTLGKDE